MNNLTCKSYMPEDWAREWAQALAECPDLPKDTESMIGWFANAMTTGYDRKSQEGMAKLDWLRSTLKDITISGSPSRVRDFLQALGSLGVTPPT